MQVLAVRDQEQMYPSVSILASMIYNNARYVSSLGSVEIQSAWTANLDKQDRKRNALSRTVRLP
jgi:hypothetical protein